MSVTFCDGPQKQIELTTPHLSKAQCMKNALNELKTEKMLRSFIRNKWREIKKNNPEYSTALCFKISLSEWQKFNN